MSIPYVFALNGYMVASAYLVIGAVASVWSNRILSYYAIQTGEIDYSDLCLVALGKRGQLFLTYCLEFYLFMSFVTYQIIETRLFKYVLTQFGFDKAFLESTWFSACFAIPLAALVIFPLSCLNNVAAFRHVSLFSIVALTYTLLIFVFEAPSYYKHFKTVAFAEPYYIDWNLLPGFAMVSFSYGCQMQLLPIQREMKEATGPRVNRMITLSGMLVFTFFSSLGVSGFISQLSEIEPVAVERKTPDGKVSYCTLAAVICMMLYLVAAFPVNVLPFKQAFFN